MLVSPKGRCDGRRRRHNKGMSTLMDWSGLVCLAPAQTRRQRAPAAGSALSVLGSPTAPWNKRQGGRGQWHGTIEHAQPGAIKMPRAGRFIILHNIFIGGQAHWTPNIPDKLKLLAQPLALAQAGGKLRWAQDTSTVKPTIVAV